MQQLWLSEFDSGLSFDEHGLCQFTHGEDLNVTLCMNESRLTGIIPLDIRDPDSELLLQLLAWNYDHAPPCISIALENDTQTLALKLEVWIQDTSTFKISDILTSFIQAGVEVIETFGSGSFSVPVQVDTKPVAAMLKV